MEIINDLYYTNKNVLLKSLKLFTKNWYISFIGVLYLIIDIAINTILTLSRGGFFLLIGSFISFVIKGALISNFLYILYLVHKNKKIDLVDIKDGFSIFFRKVISILIIGHLTSYIFYSIVYPFLNGIIPFIDFLVWLIVLILLNPLRESLYLKYYEPYETITYTIKFVTENIIEWFLPNIILASVFYFISGKVIGILDYYYLPSIFNLKVISISLFSQVIFTFIMIYRGILFEELSTSTRRKRLFKRNIYS